MNNLMNLINLKMVTAVAAVLTIVVSLAPEAAHAQGRLGLEGISNIRNGSQNRVSFDDLVTSVPDSNPDPNVGNFVGAIQNFLDEDISGNLATLSFSSGNLSASRFDVPSNTNELVPGFGFPFNDLITEPNVLSANDSFQNGGLKYEVTFNDAPNVILTLFIPSTDPELINSLSGVSQFTYILGVVSRSPGFNDDETFGNFRSNGYTPASTPFTFQNSTAVPEPNAIAGILVLGGLGAISLLRRNKLFSIHFSNRNATLSTKAGRPHYSRQP